MPTLLWNNDPLSITAKVDAVLNVTDFLDWTYDFMPALIDLYLNTYELIFNGSDLACAQGDQSLSEGLWRFSVTSGTCDTDHPVQITVNPDRDDAVLLATLTALDETVELTVRPGTPSTVRLMQSGNVAPAVLTMTQAGYFTTSGTPPTITTSGDTLTAQFPYTPRPGVLTATAHLYDGNGFLITSSEALTLTLTEGSSGGGS